ncbi:TPA: AAA family ATPase [Listeria monocytogenes]|nr:AAA family ATPase [Listeria monocytogenes]
MRLIYLFVEKFRNINNQEFYIEINYNVKKEIERDANGIACYKVYVNKIGETENKAANIESITMVVGKNGAGKTSLLQVLGDLHSSFDDSKFFAIYVKDDGNYYIECNSIMLIGLDGKKHDTTRGNFQPETTIFEINYEQNLFRQIDKGIKRTNEIEYITVRHQVHQMTYPNANAMYSYIGRYGISYENKGVYYKFKYINKKIGEEKELYKEFLSLCIELDNRYKYFTEQELKVKLIPEKYPDKGCLFDCRGKGSKLYRKAYCLKLIEIVFTFMSDRNEKETSEYIDAINDISNKCEMNIDKMYEHYDDMVEILFEMHEKLVNINFCNRTNSELCYKRFLKQIKNVIEMIPINCFENSRKIVMEWTELDKSMVLSEQLISLFELMNNVDITLDYYSSGLIKIDIMGLSDGYEMLSNLYAAIHKCFKLNNPGIHENIVLILDEPDVFMHPEWARCFIKNLIEFINDEFETNTFQIIIATHSPYLISDIAKNHVICMDNGKRVEIVNETFGQNIHILLKQSFFMESTIGEYAKQQIQEVYSKLIDINTKGLNSKYYCERNQIKDIIDSIGEPLIQNKLKSEYTKAYKDENKVKMEMYERQIIELKEKIKLLENQNLHEAGGLID